MTTTQPNGGVARYLTPGGATVDLVDNGDKAVCRGCGQDWKNPTYPFRVRQWAQSHAETCRAMPKPAN